MRYNSPSSKIDVVETPRLAVAALAVAVTLGVIPLYSAELVQLAHMSMYQFFPFVFAFIAWTGWKRWQAAAGTIGPRGASGYLPESIALSASIGCLTLHAGLFGPWLGGAAGTFAAAAAVLALRRIRDVKLWDLWALSLVAMRLPLELDRKLAATLQTCSSNLSELVLDSVGVTHFRAGNVISLLEGELFVDEACSGVVSVMSIIAVGAIVAIYRGRRALHTIVLVGMAALWAMLMNVLRISAITVAMAWYGLDWTSGTVHEVLGLAVFLVTFLAVICTDKLIGSLLAPVPDEVVALNHPGGSKMLLGIYNYLASLRVFERARLRHYDRRRPFPMVRFAVVAVVFVIAGIFHSLVLAHTYITATANHADTVELAKSITADEMNLALAPWRVTGDDFKERDTASELAPYSRSFRIRHPASGLQANVSIDFPFYRRWHDLCGCYANSGWTMTAKEIQRDPEFDAPSDCRYIRTEMSDALANCGYMLFANLSEDGKIIVPPLEVTNMGYLVNTYIHKLQHARQISLNPKKVFQVQVFAVQPREHTAEEKEQLQRLFFQAFEFTREFLKRG